MISNRYMVREIKFRGTCRSTGEWVYGLPKESTITAGSYYISQFLRQKNKIGKIDVFIAAESLGQFTGLFDKNGKEIYEGDILKRDELLFVATIDCFGVNFLGNNDHDYPNRFDNKNLFYSEQEWEIIGNTWENMKLLEAK